MVKASRQSNYEVDYFIYLTETFTFVKVEWSLSWLFSYDRNTTHRVWHITILSQQMQLQSAIARWTEQLFLVSFPPCAWNKTTRIFRSRKSKLLSIVVDNKNPVNKSGLNSFLRILLEVVYKLYCAVAGNAHWFSMATLSDGIDSQMMLRIICGSNRLFCSLCQLYFFLQNFSEKQPTWKRDKNNMVLGIEIWGTKSSLFRNTNQQLPTLSRQKIAARVACQIYCLNRWVRRLIFLKRLLFALPVNLNWQKVTSKNIILRPVKNIIVTSDQLKSD